jgi:hypothetical protein
VDFQRQLNDIVNTHLDRVGNQLQDMLDVVANTHAGQPVEAIRAELSRRAFEGGLDLNDEHLTAYAE